MLSNQVMDETYKQIENKLQRAEAAVGEAYIMAEMELKKEDVYKKMRKIKKTLNRFNSFEIDNKYGFRKSSR
jgi:predicted Zn-ribbon and HTH transcriptional regulator